MYKQQLEACFKTIKINKNITLKPRMLLITLASFPDTPF